MSAYRITRRASLFAAAGMTAVPLTAGSANALSPPPPDDPAAGRPPAVQRTPYDYGADPKAGPEANEQKAVQAMLDDCKASWNPRAGRFDRLPDLADRTWNVGKGVHLVNLRQPGFLLRNGTLQGAGKGSTVLDLSGTNSVHLHDISVFGARNDPPKVGILTSRTKEAGNFSIAPNLEWFNVRTWGSFSGAAVVSIANEVTSFLQCSIENDSPEETAFAYMHVQNIKAVTDRIGPLQSAATLPKEGRRHSNIIHSYDQVRILRSARFNARIADISRTNPAVVTVSNPKTIRWGDLKNGSKVWFYDIDAKSKLRFTVQTAADVDAAAGTFTLAGYDNSDGVAVKSGRVQNQTGPAMLFCGSHDVHISNCYALTYGNHCVVFDLVNGSAPRSFRMHIQCEHSPLAPILIAHGEKSRVWQGADIHLSNNSQHNSDCIIDDTGVSTVHLQDVRLKVNNMARPPANKVFRNPGRFTLRDCEITVPRAAALNEPEEFKAASAVFEAYDRDNPRHDWRQTAHFRLTNKGAPVATLETATADDLNDAKSPINARHKQAGKMVFSLSSGKPVFATGDSPSSPWNDAMGNPAHTPG